MKRLLFCAALLISTGPGLAFAQYIDSITMLPAPSSPPPPPPENRDGTLDVTVGTDLSTKAGDNGRVESLDDGGVSITTGSPPQIAN